MPSITGAGPFRMLGVAIATLGLVTACSSGGGSTTAPSSQPSSAGGGGGAGEEYVVNVASGSVGDYLTGEDGLTLYIFTPDSANTSTCADACAETWPPFTIEAGDTLKAGDGVTGTLSTFARADGSLQVAHDGVPLYYFASDKSAGDTNGQGVGGKWFVAPPTGSAAGSPASKGAY